MIPLTLRKRNARPKILLPENAGLPGNHGREPHMLRARIATGSFTTRGLTSEIVARGIKTVRRAVWLFLHAEGMSFKKPRTAGL